MQNQGGYPVPYHATQGNTFHDPSQGNHYHGEDEVQRQIAGYQQYTGKK